MSLILRSGFAAFLGAAWRAKRSFAAAWPRRFHCEVGAQNTREAFCFT